MLTVEMDQSTVSALMLKIAAFFAISMPVVLLANRMADGHWLPARWRR